MKTKTLFATLAIIASLNFISAQTAKTETTTKSQAKKTCYVDANNNNVCDNFENKTCTKGNGKGLMDGSAKAVKAGNGNGKCYRNGKGNGKGLNCRNAKGPNYVDANNNGICDRKE